MEHAHANRFWSNVTVRGPAECWEWCRPAASGYGTFWLNGKNRKAHRISLEMSGVPVPDDGYVLHSCDNRACVNPAHLRVGTLQDNNDDRMARGRHRSLRGEDHPNVVLSRQQVVAVWELRSRGWTTPMIAAKIGSRSQAVSAVLSGRSWSHVAPADRDPFVCPCGRDPKRGRTAHYQTCRAWQTWAEVHDPELYGMIMRGRRAQATALSRYEAFVAAVVPYLPQEVLTMYADVIRDAAEGRIAHIRAALVAAPGVTR